MNLKKLIAVLLTLTLLTAAAVLPVQASEMWGAVTVKSYEEIVEAINEKGATEIRLSKRYAHGTKSLRTNLVISGGRDIVITGPSEDTYQLKGTLDFFGADGGGTVTFQNIAVTGNDEMPAIWVGGEDLTVIAGTLQGGAASKYSGGAGLEACGSVTVRAGKVTGGSTKGNTTGGDGITAYGSAKVFAKSVAAGSASKGYGGTAVAAAGSAVVTVEGNVQAGSGMIAPGFPTAKAPGAEITVSGDQLEGEKLKGKGEVPETANTVSALRYMLLRGDREIVLSEKFSAGESQTENISALSLFSVCDGTAEIRSASPDKNAACNSGLRFVGGDFRVTGLDLSGKKGVTVSGGSLIFEGSASLTAKTSAALRVLNDAGVQWNGNIKTNGENSVAISAADDAEVTVTGSVNAMKSNAVVARDRAKVVLNGDAAGGNLKKDKAVYPVLFARENASVTVNGNITTKYQGAYAGDDAVIRVDGDLTSTSKAYYCIWISGNARIGVSGSVAGEYRTNDLSLFGREDVKAEDAAEVPAETPEQTAAEDAGKAPEDPEAVAEVPENAEEEAPETPEENAEEPEEAPGSSDEETEQPVDEETEAAV